MAGEELWEGEKWWVAHQPWLDSQGLVLRPRYRPGWKPSWPGSKTRRMDAEDGRPIRYRFLLDATRKSDGVVVMLKRVIKARNPGEVSLTTLLNSPPLSFDPRNHCTPLLGLLQVPDADDEQIMVLPLLRGYANPRFDTVGEVVDCLRQIFQGLQFLHANKIAHKDIHVLNIMMNASPLYTTPFHPMVQDMRLDFKGDAHAAYTRTRRPVKYYLIDMGLSTLYDSVDPPPLEIRILGGDKSVPEWAGDDPSKPLGGARTPHNPFVTDIYCLGNWIREDFLDGETIANSQIEVSIHSKVLGLEFLRPLVDDMVQAEPSKRPTIDQVIDRFETIVGALSTWKLRSRVAKEQDHPLHSLYLATAHWLRRVGFVIARRPAVPSCAYA